MNIKKFTIGEFETNSYLLIREKKAILIDCPGMSEIINYCMNNSIKIEKIILTHSHYDHIYGLKKRGDIPFGCYKDEVEFLLNPYLNLSEYFGENISIKPDFIIDSDFEFCGKIIRVIHTPGHTKGSVSYLIDDKIFTGDTVFSNGIGRVDFPGGSIDEIKKSIKEKILTLPDKTEVFPGHGENTTIGEVRKWLMNLLNI